MNTETVLQLKPGDLVGVKTTDEVRGAVFVGTERRGELVRVRFPWQGNKDSTLVQRRCVCELKSDDAEEFDSPNKIQLQEFVRKHLHVANFSQLQQIAEILRATHLH